MEILNAELGITELFAEGQDELMSPHQGYWWPQCSNEVKTQIKEVWRRNGHYVPECSWGETMVSVTGYGPSEVCEPSEHVEGEASMTPQEAKAARNRLKNQRKRQKRKENEALTKEMMALLLDDGVPQEQVEEEKVPETDEKAAGSKADQD